MIEVSINLRTVFVLTERPRDGAFTLKASVMASTEAGLTDREERRGLANTLLHTASYSAQITDARAFAARLRTIANQSIASPIWPEARVWSERATASITAGLYYLYRPGGTEYAVFAAGSPPGWQIGTDVVVPLLVGYLETRDLLWITDNVAEYEVRLVENSPKAWAIAGTTYNAITGPNPAAAASAPSILPFPANWSSPKQGHVIKISRERIGFGRELSETYRPSVQIARTISQNAFLDADEGWSAGKLLKWFTDHGAGRTFWAAGRSSLGRVAADVPANATSITFSGSHSVVVGDYVAAVSGAVTVAAFGPVLYTTPTAIAFPGGTNAAIPATATLIVPLVLCRLAKQEISIAYRGSDFAEASFEVRELPVESFSAPAGETTGQTLGALPVRAWLYSFERAIGDTGLLEEVPVLGVSVGESDSYITYYRDESIIAEDDYGVTFSLEAAGGLISEDDDSITFYRASVGSVVDAFTSFESTLIDDGRTFLPRSITHGRRSRGLAFDQDKITITCDGLTIAPIFDAALLRTETTCRVTIERCEIVAGAVTNRQIVFSGELGKCSVEGKKMTATAIAAGAFLDLKAPRFYLQAGCNHALFSKGCALSSEDWKHEGIVADPGTPGYPYQFSIGTVSRGGGSPLTSANAFASGWVEIGIGTNRQLRAILASSAMDDAGRITLTLKSDPYPYPIAGLPVTFYPGCDGAASTCKARFANYANFGGAPKVPKGNPSLFKLSSNVGGGGKKG